MGIDLKSLVQKRPTSTTVTIGGADVKVAIVSNAAVREVCAQVPYPSPEDYEGKEHDPAFKRQCAIVNGLQQAVMVGIAADIAHTDGQTWSGSHDAKWAAAYARYISDTLSDREFDAIARASRELGEALLKPDAKRDIGTAAQQGN